MSKLDDKLVGPGVKPELSPNPDGSGYVQQLEVDSLSDVVSPKENVLYIVGDRKYKYLSKAVIHPGTNEVIVPAGWVRVENGPQSLKVNRGQETPHKVVTEPKERPQVFNTPVSFLKDIFVKGKKLEDYIDSEGGVTEEELQAALQTKQNILVSGTNIKTVNGQTILGDGNIDTDPSDSEVEISTDGGSTYATAIPLKTFIANCELGTVYTTIGTIARISNCINGATFRFILIGLNHDILANTDAGDLEPSGTAAKTTWQFYDMPLKNVNLGLQFDTDRANGDGYVNADSDGQSLEISTAYPSNMHGYGTAVTLLDAMQQIYNSLPKHLREAMKMVRKDLFIGDVYDDDYGYYGSTITMIKNEGDRYGSQIATKLFCLSAAEVGYSGSDFATIITLNEGEADEQVVNIEGHKYAHFESGDTESARAKRIRYFGGDAYYYWLRSPHLLDSGGWGNVGNGGDVDYNRTNNGFGVAPAFCI